jgi:hypothetical protein
MNWSATFQFTSLSKAVDGDVPEWGGVANCTEEDARFFFNMWSSTRQCKNRILVLWNDNTVVDVKFVK